ncbi:MAG TPA: polysaccharide biosynthesis/export family protein, partial [Candidatus Acidoferrales bacterium]|nr:polysaccharide biosynthesis/export family protein [Candidatus Acidoferrales bacterium]
ILVFLTTLTLVTTSMFPAQAQNAASSSVSAPAQTAASNAAYRINPGDQLNVQVFGEPTLSQTVTVLDDGTVDYPLIGRVRIGDKTPAQASDTIKEALLKYIRHPIVTVAVSQVGQDNILVLGNVKTPGRYLVRSDAHLSDAVAAAGGLGPTNGDYPEARVTQPDGRSEQVSLQQLLVNGKSALNVPLANNAIVYVEGPLPIQVEVLGAVDHPGYYTVHQGDRLSAAIAQAGTSANSKADLNHVFITHQENGKPVKQEVNMYNALQKGEYQTSDPVLDKDDVVYVPIAKQPNLFNPLYLLENLIGVAPRL